MRKPKKDNSLSKGVDLKKPVISQITKTDDGDCFGEEWDPATGDCKACADSNICCVLYAEKQRQAVKKKEKEMQEQGRGYLDLAESIRAVEREEEKIAKLLRKKASEENPLSVEDLISWVSERYSISDEQAIKEWLKRLILSGQHNLKIQDRKITIKDV